jgi:DNA-binding MarR family transcriptional regulator
MNFYEKVGKMAIGTRVRSLANVITQDAFKIYEAYGNELQPKWFPVFFALSHSEQNSVTQIAEYIGHSHVSVSKIVAELVKAGLVVEKVSSQDRRRSEVTLSTKGKAFARKIQHQYTDVLKAVEEISSQATHDLWAALQEWETLLNEKSMYERVLEIKRKRELKK